MCVRKRGGEREQERAREREREREERRDAKHYGGRGVRRP
jgi:hypothetical protein